MISNKTKKQLRSLKQEKQSIKNDIEACSRLDNRMDLAKKQAPIVAKIHEIELQIEKERVAAAVKQWEEQYPPLEEKCPICHEMMRLGTNVPLCTFPCCANSICKSCGDERKAKYSGVVFTDEREFKKANSCPLCRTIAPPVGSKEMHEMVKKSAIAGRAEAQNNIGASLIHGLNNYERDPEEGWKWVQKAADQSHAKALLALGTAYYDGNEVLGQPDFSKAIPLLEKAAKIGTFEAHDRLGIAYATGNGVEKNEAKAFKHFTIAYGLGSNKAAYRLGTAYALGHPISKSVFLAKHYLEEACLKHDIKEGYALLGDAILELAMDSYGTSLHIPGHSPMPRANFWWSKAAAKGDREAQTKSSQMVNGNQQFCTGCLRTAIGTPRADGIEQCTTSLKKCDRCKTIYYCSRQCQGEKLNGCNLYYMHMMPISSSHTRTCTQSQAIHWKRGHKIDCIPKSYPSARDPGCAQS